MTQRTVSLVRAIVDRFPRLRATLDEHVTDNFGEILPHLFLGDLTRYVENLFKEEQRDDVGRLELREILNYLEDAYSQGDDDVQELISVSFLEHLPRPDEAGGQLRELVGPNLRRQLDQIG